LQRIKSLVIPPAVWISPDPLGHFQVTGLEQRGRKQYRYHPRWRVIRDEAEYGKMLMFPRVLQSIRAQVADLRRHGLPPERVVAVVVGLLELTLFRIGNSEYAGTTGGSV
jgi:DNA topoisomerase I